MHMVTHLKAFQGPLFQSFNQLGSKLRNYQTPSVLSFLQKGKIKMLLLSSMRMRAAA